MNKLHMQKLRIACLPIVLFALLGCNELVTDRFPAYDEIPTANAILEAGEPISMHISLSGGLDSLSLPNVNNALVELYVDGTFQEALTFVEGGNYFSKTIVEPGKTYTCKVIVAGYDTLYCQQTLPEPIPVYKVEHINVAGVDEEGEPYSSLKFSFPNNTEEQRYYEVNIIYFRENFNGEVEKNAAWLFNFTDRVLLNEGLPFALFGNELITDTCYTMTLNFRSGYSGGSIRTHFPYVVELRSVTYDYYRYQKQFYLFQLNHSPLYSNIENGNGIFAGYTAFISDTITPEPYEVN